MPAISEPAVPRSGSAYPITAHAGLPPDVATSAAHDFNNIFTSILLNLSAAGLDPDFPDEARKYLHRAESEIAWGREIIHMLLTLSAPGALKGTAVPVARLAESIRTAGDGTVISPPPLMASRRVSANETMIGYAFRFLACRLARTAGIGTGKISFQETHLNTVNPLALAAGEYIRVSFGPPHEDFSTEISEERYDSSGEDGESAIDLALAASDAILRRHGGALAIRRSGPEFGGFLAYLPEMAEDGESAVRGKILLMDDEESIRDIANLLFGRRGYRITTVADGAEAVRKYRAATEAGDPYDVVVMDLTIPLGMGGREAIRLIRDMDPGVRAIVSSGYVTDPAMLDCRTYGFSAAVEKPYRIETLLSTVEALLNTPQMIPLG